MSRKINTVVLVGCGGVASHILPALIHQFDLILVDGDKYEPGNVTRQLAAVAGDGRNKAEVLQSIYAPFTTKTITVVPNYLDENMALPPYDLMLVAVDNHDARIACSKNATANFAPLIWAANEEFDPQAFMSLPEFAGTWRDPIVRMGITPDGRSPLAACTSQEALDEKPQLAIANNVAGALMLAMVHALQTVGNDENLPAQFIGCNTSISTLRFRDIPSEEPKATSVVAEEIAAESSSF
jgi:molybdopterin/thiamine biosynthesis adenylyltransferase